MPGQVIVMRCQSIEKKTCSFSLTLDSPIEHTIGHHGNDFYLNGICPVHARRGIIRQTDATGRSGIRFQIRVRVLAEGGSAYFCDGKFTINHANSVLLHIAIHSNFVNWFTEPSGEFPADLCVSNLDSAEAIGYEALLSEHLIDYQELYQRSSLSLPKTYGDACPTDERLRSYRHDFSPSLVALIYHYSRYLLIASSRSGTQAANLQGIWNPHVLAPWGCNYTTNINLEMNYWGALPSNLRECIDPLLQFIRDIAEAGQETAREFYHARGWCLHHNSDLWRYTSPSAGQARWGFGHLEVFGFVVIYKNILNTRKI